MNGNSGKMASQRSRMEGHASKEVDEFRSRVFIHLLHLNLSTALGNSNCYVVYRGRQPGIYKSWLHSQDQTGGYSMNSCKGYVTLSEAISAYENHFGNDSDPILYQPRQMPQSAIRFKPAQAPPLLSPPLQPPTFLAPTHTYLTLQPLGLSNLQNSTFPAGWPLASYPNTSAASSSSASGWTHASYKYTPSASGWPHQSYPHTFHPESDIHNCPYCSVFSIGFIMGCLCNKHN